MGFNGWLISEVTQWNLREYKFMAVKEDHTKPFGYMMVYGYSLEELKIKIS